MHIVKSPLGPSSCSRTFSKRCQLIFFHLHHDQKYYYLHTWGNHEILNLFETQPELSSKKSNMDFSKACTNAIYTKYQEESENSFLKCLVMSKVIYFVIWIVSTLLLEKISDWKTVVDSLVVLSRSGLFGIRTLKQWIAAAAAAKCSLKAKPLLGKTYLLSFPSYHMKCVVSWSLNNDFSSISQEHKFSTYGFTDDVWHHSLNMRCKIWKPCSFHALFEKH